MNIQMKTIKGWIIDILDFFRHKKSYAQSGEDVVVASFFENLKGYKGFYVDVGAHHPVRFSNTYHFYRMGWRGINIDAMPGSMRFFRWFRRRDINVETGIGLEEGSSTFYCFNEPALNTFDKILAKERNTGKPYSIIQTVDIPVRPLKKVLEEYLPPDTKIDLLSIDVEGFDIYVLQSNDWEQFKPAYIIIEHITSDLTDLQTSELHTLLSDKGYALASILKRSSIYRHTSQTR
jgi:FkbM family methyltransferase